ncbi:tRNA-dihydrouridine synthase [Candidatus Parcubacteria bacterium]|nr:tRNA-dihydrouridine synthase [Candidatus Parcubacteria bacterium]
MQMGFWEKLKRPFFALAPMADVTDTAFRELIAKYSDHGEPHGGPDVFWTEFVSVDGLLSPGRAALLKDFEYTEREHPIVAQIFGNKPENFREVAKLARSLGFDGVDINMGCPDRGVEKQGAGASLIKNPKLAQEIIRATMDGAGNLPVSVKTRVGYNHDNLDEWLGALLAMKPAAITVHARTRKEMSAVPARWDTVEHAVRLAKGSGTLIIGNGDVTDLADAEIKAKATGADGIMLGRAIFGNPWLFNRNVDYKKIPVAEKLKVMVEHTRLFEKKLGGVKSFAVMKKHYKAYVNGWDGAKELRMKLMETESSDGVEAIVTGYLKA